MPLYEYKCTGCGHQEEFVEKMSDIDKAKPKKCPRCLRRELKRVISAAIVDPWKPIVIEHIEPDGTPRLFKTRKELRDRCNELGVESSALL